MKFQDILFVSILLLFFWKKNAKFTALVGVIFLLLAIPLFAKWVFFTAERLTWYAVALFTMSLAMKLYQIKNRK